MPDTVMGCNDTGVESMPIISLLWIPLMKKSAYAKTNNIQFCKPDTQVCVFEYEILPPVGNVFRVDQQHTLVVVFIRGKVYQADSNGDLHTIGLFHH